MSSSRKQIPKKNVGKGELSYLLIAMETDATTVDINVTFPEIAEIHPPYGADCFWVYTERNKVNTL